MLHFIESGEVRAEFACRHTQCVSHIDRPRADPSVVGPSVASTLQRSYQKQGRRNERRRRGVSNHIIDETPCFYCVRVMYLYMRVYIYKEREREREINMCVYTHIYDAHTYIITPYRHGVRRADVSRDVDANIYIYIYTYIYIYIYICIYIYIYIYVLYVCIYIYIYTNSL